MYGLALVIMAMVSLVSLSMSVSMDAAEARHEQQVASLAENVGVYITYAKNYRSANPSYAGDVSDTAMGLPSWFGKQENMRLYMASGRLYVYLVNVSQAQLFDTGHYIRVKTQIAHYGIKTGGQIVSRDGITTFAVPSQVPEGAFVFVI
jgi:hypothetical protein